MAFSLGGLLRAIFGIGRRAGTAPPVARFAPALAGTTSRQTGSGGGYTETQTGAGQGYAQPPTAQLVPPPTAKLAPPEAQKITPEQVADLLRWHAVQSSWIESLRYDLLTSTAYMKVRRPSQQNPSGIYQFGGMLLRTYQRWFEAGSKGRMFNAQLYRRYTQVASSPALGRGTKADAIRAYLLAHPEAAGIIAKLSPAGHNVPTRAVNPNLPVAQPSYFK